MKRSKPLTISIEPEIYRLMQDKLGPRKVSIYCYAAIVNTLVKDGHLTAEWLAGVYTKAEPVHDGPVITVGA